MRLLCLALALALALPNALAYEKLQRGDINSDVMNMQLALKSLGYTLSADGNFGSGTQRVVKAFQQRYGLKVDGVAGNETLSLLYSLAPAYDPEGGNTSGGSGNSGSTGGITGISATVVTTGGTLNLRATASSIAQVITTIPNGASVTISQLGASWCAVIYNGYHGYVMTEFLRVGTAAAPTAAPVPPDGNTGGEWARVVTTGGSLNLRAEARDTATVKTTIPYGTQVYVNNRGSSWCAVTYNGYTGYVMTQFLSFNSSATAAPAMTPAPTQKPSGSSGTIAYVQTTGGTLNLRAEAKSGAKVLTTIPYGTQLTITSVGSTWCGTYYNGYSGYVMTSFLRFVSAQPTIAPTPAPTLPQNTTVIGGEVAYVTTTGGSLNLRAEARSGSKVLTTIPNNTQLTITNRGSSWCATYYNGYSGYVMTSFLRFASGQNTQAPTPTPTPSSGTTPATYALVTTSGGTLNLRAAASTTAKVIGQIPNGSSLQVYSRGSSWCAVSYNGTSGYVMTSYLTFLSNPGTGSGNIGGGTNTDAPTSEEESDPSKYKRTLKSGMTGEDVVWVQTRLEELGYSVKITGTYDGDTISAVKTFQKQNGLDVDGLAGAQTFTILASDNARKASDAAISYTTLRIDDTKTGVTSLQKALKELGYPLTVNGEYDPDTHNAVVAFQQRNGLVISGIADSLTQHVLYGSGAKPYSTYVAPVDLSGAYMAAPAISEVKLLHWQDEIKPTVKAGQTITILEPQSGLSWSISFYSLGRHADSQPTSWRDTQIMNVALGKSDWTVHPVYVKLPDGRWTMATMHNRPHLYGSIMNNGFGGHLCIHFLRDMDEAIRNDPDYGVQNQKTLRSAWKALTGETID